MDKYPTTLPLVDNLIAKLEANTGGEVSNPKEQPPVSIPTK
jgi:hypothetical protein